MTEILVLAKVRGRAPTLTSSNRILDVIYLDVPVQPTSPIRIGSRVQVCILTPNPSYTGDWDTTTAETKYLAEPSDIQGTITGVRALESNLTELVLKNENRTVTTEYACLALPHNAPKTVDLPIWVNALRWMLSPLLAKTRQIQTEPMSCFTWKPIPTWTNIQEGSY